MDRRHAPRDERMAGLISAARDHRLRFGRLPTWDHVGLLGLMTHVLVLKSPRGRPIQRRPLSAWAILSLSRRQPWPRHRLARSHQNADAGPFLWIVLQTTPFITVLET
jgi:hypothetical protein